jgi:hypothetical protein
MSVKVAVAVVVVGPSVNGTGWNGVDSAIKGVALIK